ncbi:MAG TPA: DNA-3-methyladenine glycosylase [Bosea sp. (in: a-proteobacteria)]|jgi:DNA-3-methyladenine glycosylase|uniref:DNA-3-methyladenine glycosylase n=1 Tax=Bosea sp. (in: a-proteobacteria) TaxID=1871050 RepID=UPI002DDCFC0B|nr:DNA-3-methyladenine glycosylase [Bosea sp. (in: a-proteobacteria)]HEV2553382.1 DNA-3-methyladenine glycosylase [Bosea sp. (in: a-proteobacteria)]
MDAVGPVVRTAPTGGPQGQPLTREDLRLPAVELARRLIGVTLLCDGVGGEIVETEAYGRDDAASHSFRGPTLRNRSMFSGAGAVYVYRSYGLHWCFNIVAQDAGAVLVRAIEPQARLELMRHRRGRSDHLADGPGRLAQALGIDISHDGADATVAPFVLLDRLREPRLEAGPRIGISRERDRLWRFGLKGSPWLSRRMPICVEPAGNTATSETAESPP